MGKCFTSILNGRFNVFSDEFDVLNENQAGFRKEYSSVDNLFSIHMLLELLRMKKISFIVCLLILRKDLIMSGEKHTSFKEKVPDTKTKIKQ